jgi:hypothetical protein
MKTFAILLIPSTALLLSACAVAPARPGYAGSGYYGHDTVYVQGSDHRDDNDQSRRNVTDVNEVNVNRTNVDERTDNRTSVNDSTVSRTNVKVAAVKKKATHKPVEKPGTNQQGGQQPPANS